MTLERQVEIEVGPDRVAYQLLEGLRFTITPDNVHEHVAPHVPADLAAAQRAGPVWAFQRHLRRRVVLHAAALLRNGQAYCFAAPSGTGKSTLGTVLRSQGWGFLADDLASIDAQARPPVVEAGPPHVRLWPDAQAWAGLPREAFRLLVDGMDKLIMEHEPDQPQAALGGVFLLERGPEAACHHLPQNEAMMGLVQQTYVYQNYRGVVSDWPPEPWHFEACGAIVRSVPVWRLVVPEGLDRVAAAVHPVETAIGACTS